MAHTTFDDLVTEDRQPGSVTILGGGVVGCFLAYCLVLAGMPVTVVERKRTGAGASGASAGNVQAVTGPCGPLEANPGPGEFRALASLSARD